MVSLLPSIYYLFLFIFTIVGTVAVVADWQISKLYEFSLFPKFIRY